MRNAEFSRRQVKVTVKGYQGQLDEETRWQYVCICGWQTDRSDDLLEHRIAHLEKKFL